MAGGGSAGGVAAGYLDGTGSAAKFINPSGLAVSNSGIVYVADQNSQRIRMISPAGTYQSYYLTYQYYHLMVENLCVFKFG